MQRAIRAAAALVLVLAATSCGPTSDGDPADADGVTGTVTFWDTSNSTESPVFNGLVARFQKAYPKIDVTYTSVPFTEALDRYTEAASGPGKVPDVLRADVGWTAGLVEGGHLADLTGTRAVDGDTADFLPEALSGAVFDGRTYGVPQVTDTLALLYNRRLLRQAGVGRPPATWQQVRKAALQIKEETGADGIALNTDPYFSLPFLYGEESGMVDPGTRTITVAERAAVRAAETAAGLVSSGAAPEPPGDGTAYDAMQGAFAEGDVAMIVNGPWSTADALNGAAFEDPENLSIAPVPAAPRAPRARRWAGTSSSSPRRPNTRRRHSSSSAS